MINRYMISYIEDTFCDTSIGELTHEENLNISSQVQNQCLVSESIDLVNPIHKLVVKLEKSYDV